MIFNKFKKLTFASFFFIFNITFLNIVFAKEFLCTKTNNVNFRNGPGIKFEITHKVFAKGYPLKIIEKIENWYAVEDFLEEKMWVSAQNLSSKCAGIVKENTILKLKPQEDAKTNAHLEKGLILESVKCYNEWCFVKVGKSYGWVQTKHLWGFLNKN